MELLLIAFAAGFLTVLTPCVLPILPVVLGSSLSGTDKWRPLIISGSLMASVFVFTLVLKATTLLITVPNSVWATISGVVVLIFGFALTFPNQWSALSVKLGFEKSQELLQSASREEGSKGLVLLGVALGPVFASCSPTYAIILAVVLPQSLATGITALIMYCLGLLVPLLIIGYGGRQVLGKFKWFADPSGWFRKGMGVLLIVVGLMIVTGIDKQIESAILDAGWIDFAAIEDPLVDRLELE
ncbi:MAG: cytochrome c biogenesis CcdA family protein [Candidatus Gracilibacteria bacterium]|nr:cytochrome c biogenesis CcdA family protein [Candidatus Gracilibacteria bacterium]